MFRNSRQGLAFGGGPGKTEDEIGTGLILSTKDGGQSWAEYDSSVQGPLSGAAFCSPSLGFAIGPQDILRTLDGGAKWLPTFHSQSAAELSSVACSDSSTAWAVGTTGVAMITVDGGNSWQARQLDGARADLNRVYFSGDNGWILGRGGRLYRSENRGGTWMRVTVPSMEDLFDIAMIRSEGWIVGGRGTILRSHDSGLTWQRRPSPTEVDLLTLAFSAPDNIWAAGQQLTVLRLR